MRFKSRHVLLALPLVLICAWLFAQRVLLPAFAARGRLQQLRNQTALRVGIDPSVEPFSFYGADGWQGLDTDVAQAIATQLSTTVQTVPVGFDGRYDALETGIVDIVISAVSIDPSQTQRVAHSRAYFDAGPRLITRDAAGGVLDNARVAVAIGGESDRAARHLERRTAAMRRIATPTDAEAWALFKRGDSEAVMLEGVEAVRLGCPALGNGALRASSIYVCTAAAPNPYVVLVRASDLPLLEEINATLGRLVQTGTLNTFAAQWLR